MSGARFLNLSEVPAVLRAGAPGYGGRSFRVVVAESVELAGAFWSGGSRSVYRAVELATGRVVAPGAGLGNPPQFGGPEASPLVTIPAGWAIVEHEQGFSPGVVFHLRPENAAALLAAPAGAELSREALAVLEVTAGIKSPFRRQEAARVFGVKGAAYDSGLAELARMGYVDKRGAVTIAGRNLRAGYGFGGIERHLRALELERKATATIERAGGGS
jgi:hypothetical protein